jgi:ATP-binding cassette subfamily C (CFTR/MRP) protein 1
MAIVSNWSSFSESSSVCTRDDDTFGPSIIQQCRGGFDFTLLFEQSVLSLAPSIVLLLAVPLRLIKLARSDLKTLPSCLYLVKMVSSDSKMPGNG